VAADNEEVVFTGNATQLVAELNRIATGLTQMNGLLGKSDTELQATETQAKRLGTSLKTLADGMFASGTAAEAAASKYGKYAAEVSLVTDRLAKLQAQQDRVNAKAIIATGAPASLGNGRGEQSIAQTSTANLERIIIENDLLNASLVSQARAELALRDAIARTTREQEINTEATRVRIGQISIMEEVEARASAVERQHSLSLLGLREQLYNVNVAQADMLAQTERETAALARQAAAAKAAGAAHAEFRNNVSNARYSLYDASNTLATYSAALLALPIVTALVAASYQREFANVQRAAALTGTQAVLLKQQLIDLTTQIPLSFKQVTEISTLGAQLGIDPSGLKAFTTVVAKLQATTNLSADAAGTLLGKFDTIGNVAPAKFAALASAVLNVGVNTASTETQIAKLGTQIVGVAGNAGFTTPQIIGLAGAFASVSSSGVELARGTITQFFGKLGQAVAQNTPVLKIFADVAGVTSAQVKAAYGTDQFAGLFQKFVDGLNNIKVAGGNVTGVLNSMGITSVRYIPLLLQLANGHETLAKSLRLAQQGYDSNSGVLDQHYLPIQKTLIAQTTELANKFLALANQIGQATTGPLTDLVKITGHMVDQFAQFAKSPIGAFLLTVSGAALVLLGSLALLGAVVARLAGGIGGLYVAGSRIGVFFSELDAGAGTSSVALTTLSGAEDVATASTSRFSAALKILGGSAGLLLGYFSLIAGAQALNSYAGDQVTASAIKVGTSAPVAKRAGTNVQAQFTQGDTANRGFGSDFGIGADADRSTAKQEKHRIAIAATTQAIQGQKSALAEEKVAQDKINASFDGGIKGLDKVTASYQKSIGTLTSLNAIIGEIQGENSKKAQEDPKAPKYDGYAVSLDQYTKKLAENTVKGNEWLGNIKTIGAQLGGPVAAQFIAAGYTVVNGSLLQQLVNATPAQRAAYVKATSDSITLASQAAADALIVSGHLLTKNGQVIGKDTAASIADALAIGFSPAQIVQQFNLSFANHPLTPVVDINPALAALGVLQRSVTTGAIVATPGVNAGQRSRFADGGYTGRGGKYEIAGTVHRGEYVTPASQVDQTTGKPYWMQSMSLNASGAQPSRSFASGGYTGAQSQQSSGPMMVTLDPYAMRLLENLGNVSLAIDGREIARATNAGNFISAKRSNN
jgi:TP901 family phage tail tape measure protein